MSRSHAGGGSLPAAVRKEMGLGSRGPVPRNIRYMHSRKAVEDALGDAAPALIRKAIQLGLQGDVPSLVYCLNRLLGAPAKSERPPAEDRSLPEELRTEDGVARVTTALFATASPETLETVKQALLADLRAKGEIVPDPADIDMVGKGLESA